MIEAQILVAAAVDTDPMGLPAFRRILKHVNVDPMASFGCAVARNRSDLGGKLLAGKSDVGIYLDPDVDFTELLISQVVNRARETRGIAGGTYSHQELGYNIVPLGGHTLREGETKPQRIRLGPKSPDQPLVVDAVPAGLMAVHRDVFLKIADSFPLLRTPGGVAPVYWFRERRISVEGGSFFLSEDYSFCSYARDSGCTVELVPSAVAGHRGESWWAPLGSEPASGFVEIEMFARGL